MIHLTEKMRELCVIPKGKHKSTSSRLKFHWKCQKLEVIFLFTNSCEYDLGDTDQYDINKLFGMSYGFHHKNSVRFGWRWNTSEGRMEIMAYAYVDGNRISKRICFCKLNKPYYFGIETTEHEYILTVKDNDGITWVQQIHKGDTPNWGYRLYPYFGGNKRAPHHTWLHHSKI